MLAGLVLALHFPRQGRKPTWLARFTWQTALLSGVSLLAFTGSSMEMGIIRLGQVGSYRLPQDYLDHGPVGWGILIIGVLGILSPVAAAIWTAAERR